MQLLHRFHFFAVHRIDADEVAVLAHFTDLQFAEECTGWTMICVPSVKLAATTRAGAGRKRMNVINPKTTMLMQMPALFTLSGE